MSTRAILDLSEAPADPIERLMWLGGVLEQVNKELDPQWQDAYFHARLESRLDAALDLDLHSPKRIMAWTRAGNEARGRMVRWGDRRG